MIDVVDIVPASRSDETNQDSEPSIAVNPANPDQIVITAFTPAEPGSTNSPIYYSLDGGQTWQLNFDVPCGPSANMPGDQSVAFASGGTAELFVGFLRADEKQTEHLEVFRLDDITAGGSPPTRASSNIILPTVRATRFRSSACFEWRP